MERLDKLLTVAGCGSRREIRDVLRAGRVTVNGITALRPEIKVNPDEDEVSVDGVNKTYRRFRYYIMNKPAGVVTATTDTREKTVLDLLPPSDRRGLFPVGRLDKDTEGLLILTDNGALGHILTSPRRHVDKVYLAVISGELMRDAEERFAQGITLADGTKCLPARLERLPASDGKLRVHITLHEGKFHQVKRMVQAVGGRVETLSRLSMGEIVLPGDLPLGAYRPLSTEEITLLESYANA